MFLDQILLCCLQIRVKVRVLQLSMAATVPGSTKRKEFVENYDDFSETSLSQPATKIRRLDAEYPTSMDWQHVVGCVLDDELSEGKIINAASNVGLIRNEPFLPSLMNEERALVLYKPMYPSLKINQELITDLKNFAFWPVDSSTMEMFGKDEQSPPKSCLSMVPWVPSQAHPNPPVMEFSTSRTEPLEEPMEEEMGGASMEIEEECFHPLKQHCMISELPQAAIYTPITW